MLNNEEREFYRTSLQNFMIANLCFNLGLPTAEGWGWRSGDYDLFGVRDFRSLEVLDYP